MVSDKTPPKSTVKRLAWKPGDARVQTSVWIDKALRKRVGHMEVDRDQSYSEIVTAALEDYLRRHQY